MFKVEELSYRSVFTSKLDNFLCCNTSKECCHRREYSIRESSAVSNYLLNFIIKLSQAESILHIFEMTIYKLCCLYNFFKISFIVSRPSILFYSKSL